MAASTVLGVSGRHGNFTWVVSAGGFEVALDAARLAAIVPAMQLAHLLLFLHISTIFTAMTVAYGPLIVLLVVYSTRQVAAIRVVLPVVTRIGPLLPLLFGLGGLFGLCTAVAFGFNLLAPWLVIAYVLFAVMFLIGVTENRTWPMRLARTVEVTPDGPVTREIVELFSNSRHVVITVVDLVVVFALIFDMVLKPLS
jgi:hypothetical protein